MFPSATACTFSSVPKIASQFNIPVAENVLHKDKDLIYACVFVVNGWALFWYGSPILLPPNSISFWPSLPSLLRKRSHIGQCKKHNERQDLWLLLFIHKLFTLLWRKWDWLDVIFFSMNPCWLLKNGLYNISSFFCFKFSNFQYFLLKLLLIN